MEGDLTSSTCRTEGHFGIISIPVVQKGRDQKGCAWKFLMSHPGKWCASPLLTAQWLEPCHEATSIARNAGKGSSCL